MREFKRDCTVGFQCRFEPFGKIIDIRNMSIDIVADNQIRLLCFLGQLLPKRFTKELSQNRDAQLLGNFGSTRSWLDS